MPIPSRTPGAGLRRVDTLSTLLVQSLRLAAARDRLRPKVLVTASAGVGETLLHRLAACGTPWVNVTSDTVVGLARRAARAALARDGLSLADRSVRLVAVQLLLADVPEASAYARGLPASSGVAEAVLSAVEELRLAGVGDAAVGRLSVPNRGEAVAAVMRGYAALLRRRGWADAADALRLGTAEAARGALGSVQVLVPEDLLVTGLEAAFLNALPTDAVVRLGVDNPAGLAAPAAGRRAWPLVRGEAPPGPLHALAAPSRPESAVEVGFAASPLAEVRAALRRVLATGVPFDEVEFILMSAEPYLRIVRDETDRLGVAATFASGLPVAWTAPGRAVAAYLDWVREDFPARVLAGALAAGDLRLPAPDSSPGEEHPVSATLAARLLRRAGIGWGRERYGPALRRYADALAAPEPEYPGHRDATARAGYAHAAEAVAAGVDRLLSFTPVPDAAGRWDAGALCRAAMRVLQGLARGDGAAAALASRLAAAAPWVGAAAGRVEAVERVEAVLADLRVGAEVPAPGSVHVAVFPAGGWAGRTHTFVFGLHAGTPERAAADPLLADEDRRRLGLPTGDEVADLRTRAFRRMLAGLRGRVCLSYAATDPGGGRRDFPSRWLLQAHRLREGQAERGYGTLAAALGEPAQSHVPGGLTALDRSEAWLAALAGGGPGCDGRGALLRAHPPLRRGEAMRAARDSDGVTPFDGQISPDPNLDPRRNPDLVASAQRLELLAQCPLAYFFRYVLGVLPLDEAARDPAAWLDPRERGGLLHAIYRRVLERAGARGLGSDEAARAALAVAQEALREWRARVPVPSEAVYDREAAEVLGSLAVFLDMERREGGTLGRVYEVVFGAARPEGSGDAPPLPEARLAVAGGEVRLSGRIDRADERSPGRYRIWDYKTGSRWPQAYPDAGTLVRGRLLQHALYAAAARQVLPGAGGARAVVEASGYRFPTEAGEGQVWLPRDDPDGPLGELVGSLLDLVAGGTFVAAEDARHCGICDFRDGCEAERAAAATKAKLKAGDPRLDPLRAVAARA